MRNLKRALSLGLTAAMISGLMVMGAGAVSYPDSDQIQNQTAVEILGEIGVMVGDDNGNFNPTQDVTRAEMAVIITRILYGNDLNVDQFKGMNLFTDVPAWAEGFVNLCASLDIVAGVGDGKFAPNETVTAAQAALMLSRALGYFQNNAEFGNDWALAAIRRATSAGIIGDDMVLAANEGLSRDNVAQMTFNTLTKAVPVQYNELLNVYYNENQGITYALTFNYLQTLGYTNFDLVYDNGDTTIYGRPATTWGIGSYRTTTSDKDSGSRYDEALDANGGLISSNVQILSRDEIITVANEPDYVYTDGVDERDVYDDLGATICNDARDQQGRDGAENRYDWTIYVNGEEVFDGDNNAEDALKTEAFKSSGNYIPADNEKDDYQFTGKGAQTEIYIDEGAQTVRVVEINYYLGQVSSVREDSNGQYAVVREISDLSDDNAKLDDNDFYSSEFAKDDYVVYTIDQNSDDDFYICEMMAPETVDGTVTRVDEDDISDDAYLYLDEETRYNYSGKGHMAYDLNDDDDNDHPALDEDYTLYLDPNGYVLGYAGDTSVSYLYVEDSYRTLNWEINATLEDGTAVTTRIDNEIDGADDARWLGMDQIKTFANQSKAGYYDNLVWLDRDELTEDRLVNADVSNIDYQIFEYTTNDDGDVYSLTAVDTQYAENVDINTGDAFIDTEFHEDDIVVDRDTIFVDVENNTVYTGYDEVPEVKDADIAYVNDGETEIVFIINGEIYDANKIYFVLADLDLDRESVKHDGDTYWQFENMYVDGDKNDDLYVSYDALGGAKLQAGVVYRVNQTVDDYYITKIEAVNYWTEADVVANDALDLKNPLNWNFSKFTTDEETIYVLMEAVYDNDDDPYEITDWKIGNGDLDDIIESGKIEKGFVSEVQIVKADDQNAELVYIKNVKYVPNYDVAVNFEQDTATATYTVDGKDMTAVQSSSQNYVVGTDVVVTINASAGYDITAVTVNGVAQTVADVDTVTLTFNDLAADQTINVTTVKETEMDTLRLEGGLTNATVWYNSDDDIEGKDIMSYGKVIAREFQVESGKTVTIKDNDSFAYAVGQIIYDGSEPVGKVIDTSTIEVKIGDDTLLNDSLVAVFDADGSYLTTGTRTVGKDNDTITVTVPKANNAGNYFEYNGQYYAYDQKVSLTADNGVGSVSVKTGYIKATVGDWEGYYPVENALTVSKGDADGTSFKYVVGNGEPQYAAYGEDAIPAADVTDDIVITKGYIKVTVTAHETAGTWIDSITPEVQFVLASEDSVEVTVTTNSISEGNHELTATGDPSVTGGTFELTQNQVWEGKVTVNFTASTTDVEITLELI